MTVRNRKHPFDNQTSSWYGTEDGHEYWLCCANREEAPDKWRCYLQPKARNIFGRNKAPVDGARPLMRALHDLLAEEPGIRNASWA